MCKTLSLEDLQNIVWKIPCQSILALDKFSKIEYENIIYKIEPFLNNGYLAMRVGLPVFEECRGVLEMQSMGIFSLYTSENYYDFHIKESNKRFYSIYENFLTYLEDSLEKLYE